MLKAGREAAVPGELVLGQQRSDHHSSWLGYRALVGARLTAQAEPGAAVAVPFPTPAGQVLCDDSKSQLIKAKLSSTVQSLVALME